MRATRLQYFVYRYKQTLKSRLPFHRSLIRLIAADRACGHCTQWGRHYDWNKRKVPSR